MTATKAQKKPAVKKTPAKKTTKAVEKKTETVAPETSVETPVESTVETTTESDEKVDPTVESITNLIGKFELFEKESKLAKVELRKVLKSYQKTTLREFSRIFREIFAKFSRSFREVSRGFWAKTAQNIF